MEITKQKNDKKHPDLYKKVLKGGFWVFALRIFTAILSFIRLTVLAKLLSPNDFGMLGTALLMIGTLNTFTRTGFNAALIQNDKDITPYLNTAWTLNILRALAIFTILFFIAPMVGMIPSVDASQVPKIINIIRVTALCVLLQGFSNIGTLYFQKELQFHKKFILGSVANIVSVCASITIAIIYKSVWALVIARIISSLASCALSYYLHPYRPKLELRLSKAKELWNFGRWITVGSIIGFIMTQGDDIFAMVYLGLTSLGIYQLAYKVSNIPATEITNTITSVTFPALSLIKDDIGRLGRAYLNIVNKTSLISFTIAGLIAGVAPLLAIFLGAKWNSIGVLIMILSIKGAMRSIGSTRGPVYLSCGVPKIAAQFKLFRLCMLAISIYPATRYFGLIGLSVAISAIAVIGQIPEIVFLKGQLQVSYSKLVKPLIKHAIYGIIIFVTVRLLIFSVGDFA